LKRRLDVKTLGAVSYSFLTVGDRRSKTIRSYASQELLFGAIYHQRASGITRFERKVVARVKSDVNNRPERSKFRYSVCEAAKAAGAIFEIVDPHEVIIKPRETLSAFWDGLGKLAAQANRKLPAR
jgi:hypothetical protein